VASLQDLQPRWKIGKTSVTKQELKMKLQDFHALLLPALAVIAVMVAPIATGQTRGEGTAEVKSEAKCITSGQPGATSGPRAWGTVRIMSGSGTFAGISGENKDVKVDPGAALRGTITLRALNLGPAFAVAPLIETPSWGRHQDSWKIISYLRPGESTWNAQINERAPIESGVYHIIFAFYLETNGASVASGTNWAAGPPVWDDGNDLAEFDSSQILQAQQFGCAVNRWIMEDGSKPVYVPADAITVRVGTSTATAKIEPAADAVMPAPQLKSGHRLPIQIRNEQDLDTPVPFVTDVHRPGGMAL